MFGRSPSIFLVTSGQSSVEGGSVFSKESALHGEICINCLVCEVWWSFIHNLERRVLIGNILSWGCWSWIHLFICVAPETFIVFIVFVVLSNVISTNTVGCWPVTVGVCSGDMNNCLQSLHPVGEIKEGSNSPNLTGQSLILILGILQTTHIHADCCTEVLVKSDSCCAV